MADGGRREERGGVIAAIAPRITRRTEKLVSARRSAEREAREALIIGCRSGAIIAL
jgi:hypothetical protein